MKKIVKLLFALSLITLLSACSNVIAENGVDYSNQTLVGQISEIDGDSYTLTLGKVKEDKNKASENIGGMMPQMNDKMPQMSEDGTMPEFNGEMPTDGTMPEFDGQVPEGMPEMPSDGNMPQMNEDGSTPSFNQAPPTNEDGTLPQPPVGFEGMPQMSEDGTLPEDSGNTQFQGRRGQGFRGQMNSTEGAEGTMPEFGQRPQMSEDGTMPEFNGEMPTDGTMPGFGNRQGMNNGQTNNSQSTYTFNAKNKTAEIKLNDVEVTLADGTVGSLSDLKVGDVVEIVVGNNNGIESIKVYSISTVTD